MKDIGKKRKELKMMRFEIEMDNDDRRCWIRDFDCGAMMRHETHHFFCNAFANEDEQRPCFGDLEDRPIWCPLKEVKDEP